MAAGTIERIQVVLQAVTAGFAKGLNRAQAQLKTVGKNIQGFGTVMQTPLKQFKEMDGSMVALKTSGGRFAKGLRTMTHGMRGFRMEMLGVMFFGMMLQRTFIGLLQPVMEAFGVFDMFRIMLMTLFLPVMEMIFPFLLTVMEWFMNLPEPVKKAIGIFVILGAIFGLIIMIIGQFALGIGSLILVFSGFGMLIGIIGAVAAVLIGIGFIVYGLYLIVKGKFEGIGLVIMGIGAILLLFIGWWALIPIAVGAAVYFIIKHWEVIKEFLKKTFISIGSWFKKWFWDKPREWLNSLWNYVKSIYDKIKSIVSKSLFGQAIKLTTGVLGSFQAGGVVPQTGPYLLHRGENVIPTDKVSSGVGNVVQENNFYGFTMDDLKRELDDRDRKLVNQIERNV